MARRAREAIVATCEEKWDADAYHEKHARLKNIKDADLRARADKRRVAVVPTIPEEMRQPRSRRPFPVGGSRPVISHGNVVAGYDGEPQRRYARGGRK